MKKIRYLFYLCILCFSLSINAQKTVNINGKVIANDDVENIHVLNITNNKHAITDEKGNFSINVRLNDTISISGLKYLQQDIVINQSVIYTKHITIYLSEKINELDEVVVGKILTGDLLFDLENSDLKRDINFYDLGIPGYTGKLKTQNERRLFDADHGKFLYFYGIGFAINLNKILNRINGRTKELKNRVAVENLEVFISRLKSMHLASLFQNEELTEAQIEEFFYFCSDNPKFILDCKSVNDLDVLELLQERLKKYKANLETVNEN